MVNSPLRSDSVAVQRSSIASFVAPLRGQNLEANAALLERYLNLISKLPPLTARQFCDALFVHGRSLPLSGYSYRAHCVQFLGFLLAMSPGTITRQWGRNLEKMPQRHHHWLALHKFAITLFAQNERLQQKVSALEQENLRLRANLK